MEPSLHSRNGHSHSYSHSSGPRTRPTIFPTIFGKGESDANYVAPLDSPNIGKVSDHPFPVGLSHVGEDQRLDRHPVGLQTDTESLLAWRSATHLADKIEDPIARMLFWTRVNQAEGAARTSTRVLRQAAMELERQRAVNLPRIRDIDAEIAVIDKNIASIADIAASWKEELAIACGDSGILCSSLSPDSLRDRIWERTGGNLEAAGRTGQMPVLEMPRQPVLARFYKSALTAAMGILLLVPLSGVTGITKLKDLTKPGKFDAAVFGLNLLAPAAIAIDFLIAGFAADAVRTFVQYLDQYPDGKESPFPPGTTPAQSVPYRLTFGLVCLILVFWVAMTTLDAVGFILVAADSLGDPMPWPVYFMAGSVISGSILFPSAASAFRSCREAGRHAAQAAAVSDRHDVILKEEAVKTVIGGSARVLLAEADVRTLREQCAALQQERAVLMNPVLPESITRFQKGAEKDARGALIDLVDYLVQLARMPHRRAATRANRLGFWSRLFRRIARNRRSGNSNVLRQVHHHG